jgi:hypothetical protein
MQTAERATRVVDHSPHRSTPDDSAWIDSLRTLSCCDQLKVLYPYIVWLEKASPTFLAQLYRISSIANAIRNASSGSLCHNL